MYSRKRRLPPFLPQALQKRVLGHNERGRMRLCSSRQCTCAAHVTVALVLLKIGTDEYEVRTELDRDEARHGSPDAIFASLLETRAQGGLRGAFDEPRNISRLPHLATLTTSHRLVTGKSAGFPAKATMVKGSLWRLESAILCDTCTDVPFVTVWIQGCARQYLVVRGAYHRQAPDGHGFGGELWALQGFDRGVEGVHVDVQPEAREVSRLLQLRNALGRYLHTVSPREREMELPAADNPMWRWPSQRGRSSEILTTVSQELGSADNTAMDGSDGV